ncbi:MAG: hypothetical protein U9N77_09095 [Thermodesulfobacteriota bacterium]|nr:hypothetical protein [Thermodesulfobacteriota bacterium]
MENFAYKIEDYLQKKLLLYHELTLILKQEKEFIVDMDTEALWVSCSKKKELTAEIERVRSSILYLLDESHVEHGMDVRAFSLTALIRLLPVPAKIKSDLGKTRLAINLIKDELHGIASENRTYVREYLSVIDGIMSNFAEPVLNGCYSFLGYMCKAGNSNALINAEV